MSEVRRLYSANDEDLYQAGQKLRTADSQPFKPLAWEAHYLIKEDEIIELYFRNLNKKLVGGRLLLTDTKPQISYAVSDLFVSKDAAQTTLMNRKN